MASRKITISTTESVGVHCVLRECENLKIQNQMKGSTRKVKKMENKVDKRKNGVS